MASVSDSGELPDNEIQDASFSPASSTLFERLEGYPWATDADFQSGLSALLGASTEPTQVRDLTLRARCFYYTRCFNQPIDYDAYRAWYDRHSRLPGSDLPANELPVEDAKTEVTDGSASNDDRNNAPSISTDINGGDAVPINAATEPENGQAPPPPASFAEIMQMIQDGVPIPGIREIPNTVLHGQGSQSTGPSRPKPWEGRASGPSLSSILG